MTKSREKGEDEITDQAKREALRNGMNICDTLKDMLKRAKAARDNERVQKIQRAEKFLGCRNKRKRGNTP